MLFSLPSLPCNAKDKRVWGQLYAAAHALAIAEITVAAKKPVLALVKDTNDAHRLMSELRFFLAETKLPILLLPDWEILPYDTFSAHPDIISERISTLNQISHLQQGVIVVSLATLLHRLPPSDYLNGTCFDLQVKQKLAPGAFRCQLEQAGYQCVETVFQPGEFALRGGLLDVYPMGSREPLRIEWVDDEIESLRYFSTETQRTTVLIEKFRLLPAREFPLGPAAIRQFRQNWGAIFDVNPQACPVYQDVSQGITSAGIEYYMPLFFNNMAHLFNYLPPNTLLIHSDNLESQAQQFWSEVIQRYDDYRHDLERPLLSPEQLFIRINELFVLFAQWPRIQLQQAATHNSGLASGHHNFNSCSNPNLAINNQLSQPLSALQGLLEQPSQKILVCAESAGRRESLLELFKDLRQQPVLVAGWQQFINQKTTFAMTIADLDQGLHIPEAGILLISETQLFGQKVLQRRQRNKTTDPGEFGIRNLAELTLGQPVVHRDHGIGRYQGLQTITIEQLPAEFLVLEYADQAKLYVPVASLRLLCRYHASDVNQAPLHRLGSAQWRNIKRKATEKIKDTAAELLHIYAQREKLGGFCYPCPGSDYTRFANAFAFEETPDQQQTINAVLKDMMANQPMDRLVCGDVGFGKTEVAMRAAFLAIQGDKQVAILAPTTLLAQQHYATFRDRFADWPVNIAVMSRFQTSKENKENLSLAAQGQLDILIGTHKILQHENQFKRLGLLIIDEEHRFGVQQKERLKKLRAQLDILTLTATPIPRTLNLSMSGMRDLSIIATPPARRIAIKTFVRQYNQKIIKEAILRELLRGGQIYYLHNEVKTINTVAEQLQQLVPEARIGIVHGQMRERQLEQVMRDFYHKHCNVLVCSTIIETGIDIPNANTIIIERADKFGLAQLHQLRGRVGRSHHQAYAYLLIPNPKNITRDAHKRLQAIESTTELGSGFTLASHDLEIRGAGALLGEEQSGQIQNIGFSLYIEMLEQTVKAMQTGSNTDLEHTLPSGTEVNLNLPALIPESYLPDVYNRLMLYQRIANTTNAHALQELQVEMIDRFGPLPLSVKNLLRQTQLTQQAQQLGITRIDANASYGKLEFDSNNQVNPTALVKLVQQQPHHFRLEGNAKLRFTLPVKEPETRFQYLEDLLKKLAQSC